MVYVILGEGFEEIEAIAPVDILRRGGAEVRTVGLTSDCVAGAHGMKLCADMSLEDMHPEKEDHIVIPGGLGGVESCEKSGELGRILREAAAKGTSLCAICAGPRVLARLGLADGKKMTCYPGMEEQMTGALANGSFSTVTDGGMITGRAPGSAFDFGFDILRAIKGGETAARVAADMHYPPVE